MYHRTRTALRLAGILLATAVFATVTLYSLTAFIRAATRARQDLMVP